MSLTSILVHVDDTDRGRRNVSAAIGLADAHDAHLIGLFVRCPANIPTYASVHVPPEVFDTIAQDQKRSEENAGKSFLDCVKAAGREDRSEWRVDDGQIAESISRQGRRADLIVLGQEDDSTDIAAYGDVPDIVVMDAGRPVLIVPHIGPRETIGERILIAWDDSREAARAVADALPFLKRATTVTVLTVDPNQDLGDVPGAGIARYLAGHGVTATVSRIVDRSLAVDDYLLNQASDESSDLIVMGAYGHSRLREMVLGGVTRHMLDHMTVPVVMSH